jgi:hypothetical protein
MGNNVENYLKKYATVVFVKGEGIGSGRIPRRFYQLPFSQLKKTNRSRENILRINSPEEKRKRASENNKILGHGRFKFPTSSHKLILQRWNNKKHPFTVHRLQKSTLMAETMAKLNKLLKKYEAREIIAAIDICHATFSAPWFKYGIYKKQKLKINEFFEYSNDRHKYLLHRNRDIPKSWFQECLKGVKYMQKTYTFVPKDKDPATTKQLTKIFLMYQSRRKTQVDDPAFRSTMISWGNKLKMFSDQNSVNFPWLIDFIEQAMINYKTIFVKNSHELLYTSFYLRKIPEAMLKYNYTEYKDRNFIFDSKGEK